MINDDDLLLYYYRDGLDADERARIGAALAAQPELAQRLHRLVARLDAAAAQPEVPVPAHVQQRWEAALDAAAREGSRAAPARRGFPRQWLAAAAAVTAVAIVVIFETKQPATNPSVVNEPANVVSPNAAGSESASAYENGLKFHLASTERRLASLESATPEERARLVETIIGQNRVYALAAERAGEPQLARVLRAFAPVLEDVANGHAASTDASLAQLNFELRVMQARLSAEAQAPTNTL
jgi:hypothetical protein